MQSLLSALRKSLAELQQQTDSTDREERAKKITKHQEMIPRPKGRPGRRAGNGYSIIEEMGLSEKREQYNFARIIRRLAIKYLNTTCTLTQQNDKLLVEKVIRRAQLESKELMKYENAWPVRDMLAQYLRNSSQAERKRIAKVKRTRKDKRNAMSSDSDSEESAGSDADSESSDGLNEGDADMDSSGEADNEEEEEDGSESESEEDHVKQRVHLKTSKSRSSDSKNHPQKRRRNEEEEEDGSESESAEDHVKQRVHLKTSKSRSSDSKNHPQKRRRHEEEEDGDESESEEDHVTKKQAHSKTSKSRSTDSKNHPQKRHRHDIQVERGDAEDVLQVKATSHARSSKGASPRLEIACACGGLAVVLESAAGLTYLIE